MKKRKDLIVKRNYLGRKMQKKIRECINHSLKWMTISQEETSTLLILR